MRRLTCLMLLIITCSGLVVGCWDQDEITSLAVVTGIGIDAGERPDMLRICIQISPPVNTAPGGSNSGGNNKLRVLCIEAESVLEGILQIQAQLRRKPFLLHLNFIVFGENLARSGINGVIPGLQGAIQIRGSVPVFVTYGSAERVLRAHSGIGRTPGEDITELLQNTENSPVSHQSNVNELVNTLQVSGKELALPILDLSPLELGTGDDKPADGIGQGGERYAEVVIARTALFQRDRWVDTLEQAETGTLVLLLGEGDQAVSTVSNPANESEPMAVQYENFKLVYDIAVDGANPPRVVLKPEVTSRLLDMHGGYDLATRGIKPIELAVEYDLGLQISQLIARLQSLGLDTLGFGQKIAQRYPRVWSQLEPTWSTLYPHMPVDVQPHAVIRNTGLIKKFFQPKP